MADWMDCKLIVRGCEFWVGRFLNEIGAGKLVGAVLPNGIVSKLVPYPDDYLPNINVLDRDPNVDAECKRKYGHAKVWDWQVEHWGCRRGDCDTVMVKYVPGWAMFEFVSPSGIPDVALTEISRKWDMLQFHLCHPGGAVAFEKGVRRDVYRR